MRQRTHTHAHVHTSAAAQVVDFQVVLGEVDSSTLPGAVLHTGAITVHSSKLGDGVQPGQRHFATAHAAFELLSAVLQRRRERQGQHPAHEPHSGGECDHAGAESDALAAAVAAVEQQLVYQHLEFAVAGLQLAAVSAGLAAGEEEAGSPASAQHRTVLQPLQLRGRVKLHRIVEVRACAFGCQLRCCGTPPRCLTPNAPALCLSCLLQDAGVPQVHCTLHVGQVRLAITPEVLQQLAAAAQPPAAAAAPGRISTAAAAAATSVATPSGPQAALTAAVARTSTSSSSSSSPVVQLEVQLSSLDASYYEEGGGGRLGEAHVHLGLAGSTLGLQVLPEGLTAEVRAGSRQRPGCGAHPAHELVFCRRAVMGLPPSPPGCPLWPHPARPVARRHPASARAWCAAPPGARRHLGRRARGVRFRRRRRRSGRNLHPPPRPLRSGLRWGAGQPDFQARARPWA